MGKDTEGGAGEPEIVKAKDHVSYSHPVVWTLHYHPCFLNEAKENSELFVFSKWNSQDVSTKMNAKYKGLRHTGSKTPRTKKVINSQPNLEVGYVSLDNLPGIATQEQTLKWVSIHLFHRVSKGAKNKNTPTSNLYSSTGCGWGSVSHHGWL